MAELLLERNTIYKEEVDMILEGKSNEEISKHMQEEIDARRKEEEKVKLFNEKEEKIKEIGLRVKTAEIYLKQGIISKEDYELVLREHENAVAKINAKYEESLNRPMAKRLLPKNKRYKKNNPLKHLKKKNNKLKM